MNIILFVYKLVIGCSNKNYPKKAFEQIHEESRIKILPWVSADWPLNN